MAFQEIYKEKGQEPSRIWGKYILVNGEATTKEIELALKHIKSCSTPLTIREMQVRLS